MSFLYSIEAGFVIDLTQKMRTLKKLAKDMRLARGFI
jgi:hypothetical protein